MEDNISKYPPNLVYGDQVKIKHLLSQTSGLQTHTDTIWANNDARRFFANTMEVIEHFGNRPLHFPPGSRHEYCNTNYLLLGYIVEQVSGLDYATYLQKHTFDPLGMTATLYPKEGAIIPNLATGYESQNDQLVYARYHSHSQMVGQSSIHSTVEDLSKWYRGLMNSKILKRENLLKAWQPYILNNGAPSIYGYGFYAGNKFNKTAIYHNGFIFGYSTSDLYFPEEDLLILVTSNISDIDVVNTNTIAFDIAASYFHDDTVEITEELLNSYTGLYTMKAGFKAKVFREGLQLKISVDGQAPNNLYPETQTLFLVKDFPAKVQFLPSTHHDNMGIILSMGPDQFEGRRTQDD